MFTQKVYCHGSLGSPTVVKKKILMSNILLLNIHIITETVWYKSPGINCLLVFTLIGEDNN